MIVRRDKLQYHQAFQHHLHPGLPLTRCEFVLRVDAHPKYPMKIRCSTRSYQYSVLFAM